MRLWRELVSNSIVVIEDFLVYCRQEIKGRVEDEGEVESVADGEGEGQELVEVCIDDRDSTDDGLARQEASEASEVTPVKSAYVEKEQAREMEAVVNVEQLGQTIDEWKQLCVLCKIHGRVSKGH